MAEGVHADGAAGGDGFGVGAAEATAAEHGAHAGDDFAGAERFADVVIGAEAEADDEVALVVFGGDHDDESVAQEGVGLDGAAEFQAVEAREHEVEEDDLRGLFAHEEEAGATVALVPYAKPLAGKAVGKGGADIRLIFNDYDFTTVADHAAMVGRGTTATRAAG